jgi:type VI secretion system secreted protein VgrG
MGIEAERHLALHCTLGPDALLIRHFSGLERLGACFEYVLHLYSEKSDVDAKSLLGQHASVRMRCGKQPERYFDGVVCEFGPTRFAGRYFGYRMVLRPWFWLLSRNRDSRIFQRMSTLDIARDVFSRWGFSDFESRVTGSFPTREYCVQYRESDLGLISRLLEEDGIYYYFKHELGRHVLVLADSSSAHESVSQFETLRLRKIIQDHPETSAGIHWWITNAKIRPGKVELRDYDFQKPNAQLDAKRADPKEHSHADAELYDYPGDFSEVADGESRAKVRLQEALADYEIAEGDTDASGLFAGATFNLEESPHQSQNHEYLIVSTSYDADSGVFESGTAPKFRFNMRLRAIDNVTTFRPARVARRSMMPGAQTAIVVGPKGREIWTDEYGRVRVQFHWDRQGKRDESSSCWIRVAQLWTGSGWGSLHIPRIGQEVIVDFLEGNPDRPIVTGCVYNESNHPPYALPDKQTQSGVKTRSTEHGGQDDYNEIRLDDSKGNEELLIHAQRDMNASAKRNLSVAVGHDEKRTVQNNLSLRVASGDFLTEVQNGHMSVIVSDDAYSVDAKKIFGTGWDEITFEVGGSSIKIEPEAVTLSSGINKIVLDGSGITIDGKPLTKINC